MVRLTRMVRRLLLLHPCEIGVEAGFVAGERWARALGFAPTGLPLDRWPGEGRPILRWEAAHG